MKALQLMWVTEGLGRVGRETMAPGAAGLHLVDGLTLLRPEEQVLDAMLDGWRNQQLARNLAFSTIGGREKAVRAFARHADAFPGARRPARLTSGSVTCGRCGASSARRSNQTHRQGLDRSRRHLEDLRPRRPQQVNALTDPDRTTDYSANEANRASTASTLNPSRHTFPAPYQMRCAYTVQSGTTTLGRHDRTYGVDCGSDRRRWLHDADGHDVTPTLRNWVRYRSSIA
jgi:hypothetical protein